MKLEAQNELGVRFTYTVAVYLPGGPDAARERSSMFHNPSEPVFLWCHRRCPEFSPFDANFFVAATARLRTALLEARELAKQIIDGKLRENCKVRVRTPTHEVLAGLEFE